MASVAPYIASGYSAARMAKWLYNKRYRSTNNKQQTGNIIRLNRRITRLERGGYQELKTHDKSSEGTRGTTGTIIPLSEVAQGDTSLTREGLQIRPRFLVYKIFANGNSSGPTNQVRLIIFTDKGNQGTYPTAAQLLEADSMTSWAEHDTRPRFKIHRDMIISVPYGTNNATFRKGIIKFNKNKKIWYTGTTAAEASNGKNALFAYIISNDNTNQPTCSLYTRLRFVD